MKIVYITANTPYGKAEAFIPPEIIEVKKQGNEMLVIPLRPEADVWKGAETEEVAKYTMRVPIFSLKVLAESFIIFCMHPIKVAKLIGRIFNYSGSAFKIIKNLAILPKALLISKIVKENKCEHIHAHWASTTSTAAYIASYITDIPWSFTAHRWDIAENNMLKEKARTAKFVRVIDEPGYNEMIGFIGSEYMYKCHKIHVGVKIDQKHIKNKNKNNILAFAVPAMFVEKKGHTYLLEAIKKLKDQHENMICYFIGDGPLRSSIEKKVNELGLQSTIIFKGNMSHDDLLSMYENGEIDFVVLPSIVTNNGEKEGIPVSLMEAMAYKLPVISTNTGGIPELLENGAGIIVKEKDSKELAAAMKCLIENNENIIDSLKEEGYKSCLYKHKTHPTKNKV